MNLKDFENDIKETENIIKYYKIRNIKIFFKKNLKKFKVVQKSLRKIWRIFGYERTMFYKNRKTLL